MEVEEVGEEEARMEVEEEEEDTSSVNTLSWTLAAFQRSLVSWRLSVVVLLKPLQVQLLISGADPESRAALES